MPINDTIVRRLGTFKSGERYAQIRHVIIGIRMEDMLSTRGHLYKTIHNTPKAISFAIDIFLHILGQ